jgi:hypothetical protein
LKFRVLHFTFESALNGKLIFFMDSTTGGAGVVEAAAGVIYYLTIGDSPS